ncbi:ankyrin repeat domain-containing protein [Chamaesiphon sp. OTE_8_metabat_110]|uniref:ankyrin repeat domain-containing protein n=1 Tax=Chamaesiphon sp. OTE_8_metabat_110 TaxID=2964696 RepID=UPI00286CAEC0|nr:ankyrin repeat domain-containing protein [Chamaesiphon sp. OTE_8_metabat_110]
MSVDPRTQLLFDAIAAANYDRVKLAIDSGAAINSPNDRGQTPLVVACRQGSLQIVDLLVAAGAQMQAQLDPASSRQVLPVEHGNVAHSPMSGDNSDRSVATAQQIPFENLIDLIHQPAPDSSTQIEQIMPEQYSSRGNGNRDDSVNWLEHTSEPDLTYTFDLDEVFATATHDPAVTLDRTEVLKPGEINITPFPQSLLEDEIAAGETYAFDLSIDLDRLSSQADAAVARRSIPMNDDWASETYVVENRAQILPDLDLSSSDRVADSDLLFGMDETLFNASQTWEDGETYAIDLDDLVGASPAATAPAVHSEAHLLSDLDSSLFPVIGGEDEPDFDPDTQTSTDIFGVSGVDRESHDVPVYEENATNSSLMAAAIDGDLDLVQQAIEAGASLDRYDWNLGYSPLGMAIDRGHIDLVQCLLGANANPHSGSVSTTALGLAAERGEVEIIQMLLPRGVDVNAPVGQDGWTALLSAIKNGHRSVVQLLVTAGANVNVWSRGETPILLAAKCEDRDIYHYLYPLVNTTIRLCADRDGEQLLQATRKRRIREQNRPVEKFIEMATIGNIDEVNRAIEIGVEIDEIGAKGHTALMAAAYYGHR